MADIIDELMGMDDAALGAKLGFDKKLEDAKTHLGELAALSGEARKIAADRVEHMFTPNIYPDEWGWIARDAQREVAQRNKSAKEEMLDTSPASIGPR